MAGGKQNRPGPQNPAEPTGDTAKPVQDSGNNPGRNDPLQASGDAPAVSTAGSGAVTAPDTVGGPRQAGPLGGPSQGSPSVVGTAPAGGPGMQFTATAQPPRATAGGPKIEPTEEVNEREGDFNRGPFPGIESEDEPAGVVGASLGEVVQHFRAAASTARARQWDGLAEACGYLLFDLRDVLRGDLTFLPRLKGAAPGQEVQADPVQVQNIRAEFENAVREFEFARADAINVAPTVSQTAWHQTGGPVSGQAMPRGTPSATPARSGMVAAPVMESQWLVFLLEVGPVLISALRRALQM